MKPYAGIFFASLAVREHAFGRESRTNIRNDDFKLWIGCGNYEEYPDGFLCFIEPHEPVIRKLFKKIYTRARVEALQKAMDAVLAESVGIRDKKWWTHEEFNNARA